MKRKKLFVWVGFILLFLIVTGSVPASGGKAQVAGGDKAVTLEVLNPRGVIEPPPNLPLSPRVTDLAGKTIGLYNNGKEGFSAFLDVVEKLLKEKYPTATILRYRGAFDLGDNAAKDIAKEVDTFIYGVGD